MVSLPAGRASVNRYLDLTLRPACRAVLITLPFVLLSPARGQRHDSSDQTLARGTFELGMTPDAASKSLGPPSNGSYRYARRTDINEYELRLEFGQDDSESRLHPVTRLRRVEIMIDRPRPAKLVLADIPEALQLCDGGCSLLGGISDAIFLYEPHIIAYPVRPTAKQSSLAALLGTNWRPGTAKTAWVPAVILRWGSPYGTSHGPVDWLNKPIERATFTVVAPSAEMKPMKYFNYHPPVELGTWTAR
jgi:hypothetical protein